LALGGCALTMRTTGRGLTQNDPSQREGSTAELGGKRSPARKLKPRYARLVNTNQSISSAIVLGSPHRPNRGLRCAGCCFHPLQQRPGYGRNQSIRFRHTRVMIVPDTLLLLRDRRGTAFDEGKVKSMKLVCMVAGLVALLISPVQAQEQDDVAVTQLLSTTVTSSGQPIVLPRRTLRSLFRLTTWRRVRHCRCTSIPILATHMCYRGTCV
jgi:hypothetical protein